MRFKSCTLKSILLMSLVASGSTSPAGAAPIISKKTAPPFRVTSLEGREFDLADLRGKVVVLNLWFIGCPPCRTEIPGLNKLVEEFKDRDVVFLALALDSAEELRTFLQEQPFSYHVIPDAKQVIKRYGGHFYPKHIIIDMDGRIEWTKRGGKRDRYKDLRPVIERLLVRAISRAAAPNNGMHPTRNSAAPKLNLLGGRVLPGVRRCRSRLCS